MKKLVLLLCVGLISLTMGAQTQPAVGDGSEGSPYEISNAQELLWFAQLVNGTLVGIEQNVNANAIQTADIDLSSVCSSSAGNWTPIGNNSANDKSYGGNYDGQGHTISNLYIVHQNESTKEGLFGFVSGHISNLNMTAVYINTPKAQNVGAVVALGSTHELHGVAAHHCTVSGRVIGGENVGGVVGSTNTSGGGWVTDCVNNAAVTGRWFVGGVAGRAPIVYRCQNNGNVTASENHGGGITSDAIIICDCYNTGNITGNAVGGIAAYVSNELSNVLTTGNVIAKNSQSGLICATINTYNCAGSMRLMDSRTKLTIEGASIPETGTRAYYDYYTDAMSEEGATKVNASTLSNGATTFLLQNERAELVWGQNIETDKTPVLNGTTRVYGTGSVNCLGYPTGAMTYNNTSGNITMQGHTWTAENTCSACYECRSALQDSEGYYLIGKPYELCWLKMHIDRGNTYVNVRLTDDIDMSGFIASNAGRNWTWMANGSAYHGIFDGQGHTISGLKEGLFVNIYGAEISNLTVSSSNATNAILSALAEHSTITNVTTRGRINTSRSNVGGVVGKSDYTRFVNCTNYADITTSGYYIAGIVGWAVESELDRCINYGNVTCGQSVAGGLIGYMSTHGGDGYDRLNECANLGTVRAEDLVGGLIGNVFDGLTTVTNCFASCDVYCTKGETAGYLVGKAGNLTDGAFDRCYYNSEKNCFIKSQVKSANVATGTHAMRVKATAIDNIDVENGTLCYNLNSGVTNGTQHWYQNLNNGSTVDKFPVLDSSHGTVYGIGSINCMNEVVAATFSNTSGGAVTNIGHVYGSNGLCKFNHEHVLVPEQTADGVYQIANLGNLVWLRNQVNASTQWKGNVVLTADIDMSPVCGEDIGSWKPIGWTGNYTANSFCGTFDGQGHSITGLFKKNDGNVYGGLFGIIYKGTIKNLSVTGNLKGYGYIGMLANILRNSTVENCEMHGTIESHTSAGFAYTVSQSVIQNCRNYVDIFSPNSGGVGGIAGSVSSVATAPASIIGCTNFGNLTYISQGSDDGSRGLYMGGIIGNGAGANALTVKDCLNAGKVHGSSYVGGIVGYLNGGTDINIINCLVADTLSVQSPNASDASTSNNSIIATAGNGAQLTITNCYYSTNSFLILNGVRSTARPTGTTFQSVAALASGSTANRLNSATGNCGVWGQISEQDPYPVPYAHGGHVYSATDALTCGCASTTITRKPEQDEKGNYLIANASNLCWFRDYVNDPANEDVTASARQTANISLHKICGASPLGNWEPIGKGTWCGVYDGQGYSVRSVYIDETHNLPLGLFGHIGQNDDPSISDNCCIKNLTVDGTINVHGVSGLSGDGIAILCGRMMNGTIENCTSQGSIESSVGAVGGIVGYFRSNKRIINCCNEAYINGSTVFRLKSVGGIAGVSDGQVTRSANTGNVICEGAQYIGGIVGSSYAKMPDVEYAIDFCYNTGTVIAAVDGGGIAGVLNYNAPLTSCYNYGQAYSSQSSQTYKDKVCPLIGKISSSGTEITNCYYNSTVATMSGPETNAIGKTAQQFKSGEVAYLLGTPWGQSIDLKYPYQNYPVLDGLKVFYKNGAYSNYLSTVSGVAHMVQQGLEGKVTLQNIETAVEKVLE